MNNARRQQLRKWLENVENIKSACLDSSITKKVKTHKYRSATKFFNEYKINKPEQPFPFY